MTGPEHYREAEACRAEAKSCHVMHPDNWADGRQGQHADEMYWNAAAQVHATLALAAAIRWSETVGQERPAP